MSTNFKPMLAVQADLPQLQYPVLASPKLDGIRCIIRDGVVLSRSLKPIRNAHVQKLFGVPELEGYDGELIVGEPNAENVYLETNSGVMSAGGEPDVRLFAFDHTGDPGAPFTRRYEAIKGHGHPRVELVPHHAVDGLDLLMEIEARYLEQGYEGLMLRDPFGPYKHGRSTLKEGILLKLKRFEDSEAEVIGFVEQMHNANEARKDALGHTERSTAKAGLVPAGMLGALQVRDIHTGVEFEIGTGFTREQRLDIFANQDKYRGVLAKYQYFAGGSKERPRFPSWKGWRDREDL